MSASHFKLGGVAPRSLLVLATVAASLGSLVLLLAGFDAASPRRWLAPSSEVLELVSQCDRLRERSVREACARRVVAALLQEQQHGQRVAQR